MMNAPIMTYRYNLSKKNYIKFLKMLGVDLIGPDGAKEELILVVE